MIQRGGVRVGIVGATTPGSNVWDRDNLRAAGGMHVDDIVGPALRQAVSDVRAQGAAVVIALLHSGLDEPSSYDTTSVGAENSAAAVARDVPGIDVIVFGHTHGEVADTTIGAALLVQPRQYAGSVGVVHLRVARQGAAWHVVDRRSAVLATAGHAESPTVLAATRAAHARTLARVRTVIATTPSAWRADSARVADTPVMDFVLETMRRAAGAQLAANAAFTVDAAFGPGPVTLGDILRLYPFENTLRAVRVSGAQLRAFLEQSARYFRARSTGDGGPLIDPRVPGYNFDVLAGADYTLDLSRPPGARVVRLEYRGRPVADRDTFTLALNNYRQTGGGGFAMLAGAPVVYDRGERIADLLVAEARRRGVLRPGDFFQRNWMIVPADAVARAYAELHPDVRQTTDSTR
jgi:2',3'-cyclic-nucleotide 2'-phosphodiesterase/3'-nucleotidase